MSAQAPERRGMAARAPFVGEEKDLASWILARPLFHFVRSSESVRISWAAEISVNLLEASVSLPWLRSGCHFSAARRGQRSAHSEKRAVYQASGKLFSHPPRSHCREGLEQYSSRPGGLASPSSFGEDSLRGRVKDNGIEFCLQEA